MSIYLCIKYRDRQTDRQRERGEREIDVNILETTNQKSVTASLGPSIAREASWVMSFVANNISFVFVCSKKKCPRYLGQGSKLPRN